MLKEKALLETNSSKSRCCIRSLLHIRFTTLHLETLFEELVRQYYNEDRDTSSLARKYAVCAILRDWHGHHERMAEDVRVLLCNFEQV